MEAGQRMGSSRRQSFRRDSDPTVDARSNAQKNWPRSIQVCTTRLCEHIIDADHTPRSITSEIRYMSDPLRERSTMERFPYQSIRYPCICCKSHDARSKLHRQAIRNSWPTEQIGIVVGLDLIDWLTLNRIEFATKDTRRLLPGRIFGLPSSWEWPASIQTASLKCVSRQPSTPPPKNCGRTQWTLRFKFKITIRLKCSNGRASSIAPGQRWL